MRKKECGIASERAQRGGWQKSKKARRKFKNDRSANIVIFNKSRLFYHSTYVVAETCPRPQKSPVILWESRLFGECRSSCTNSNAAARGDCGGALSNPLPNRIEEGDADMTVSSAPGLISSIGVGDGTSQSSNNTRAPEELGRPTPFTPRRSLFGEAYLPNAEPPVCGGAYILIGDTFSLSSRDTTPTPPLCLPPRSFSISSSSSSIRATTLCLFFFPVVVSPLSGAVNRPLRWCAPKLFTFAGVLAFGVFTANLPAPSPRDDRDPPRDDDDDVSFLPPPRDVVVVVFACCTVFKFTPPDGVFAFALACVVVFFAALAAARNALWETKFSTHRAHPRSEYLHFEHPIERRLALASVASVRAVQVTPTRDSLDEFEFLEFDFLEL
jgi:hypothetical protein